MCTDVGNDDSLKLALVDDYDVVLYGLKHMLDPFRERVEVVDIAANEPVDVSVDVALFDTFAQPEADQGDIDVLIRNPRARKVVVYTWCFEPHVIETALAKGVDGYLSKTLRASELVEALEAIHVGERVVSPKPRPQHHLGKDWPGRSEGLTERESEIIALITQGHSNAQIAAMTYLSINSIKTYIRSAYRKIGVERRTQAVLWGIEHGFRLDQRRIDTWRVSAAGD